MIDFLILTLRTYSLLCAAKLPCTTWLLMLIKSIQVRLWQIIVAPLVHFWTLIGQFYCLLFCDLPLRVCCMLGETIRFFISLSLEKCAINHAHILQKVPHELLTNNCFASINLLLTRQMIVIIPCRFERFRSDHCRGIFLNNVWRFKSVFDFSLFWPANTHFFV